MSLTKPLVIVLLGPTASGKTDLAIEVAEHMNLTIHNVDSRQVYIGMDIGTAKPTKQQQKRIAHHLIDIRPPDKPMSMHEFQQEAYLSLKKNLHSKNMAFLVGGSGLYLKSLILGLQPPAVPPQDHLRKQFQSMGQGICYQLLQTSDPDSASRISPADEVRTQRALEVFYVTGQPFSSQKRAKAPPWRVIEMGLDPQNLRTRIAERTKQLYKNGLLEETKYLSNRFSPDLPMLQTIGYKEALHVIQDKLNLDEAISLTTQRTQQFAKRQRTWFKKQHNAHWLKDDEPLREALSLIKAGLG